MRIKLDRTVCDGFGTCALHAAAVFSLDDWGYPSLLNGNLVASEHENGVRRAILNCPAHAIIDLEDTHPDLVGGDAGVSRSGRPDARWAREDRPRTA